MSRVNTRAALGQSDARPSRTSPRLTGSCRPLLLLASRRIVSARSPHAAWRGRPFATSSLLGRTQRRARPAPRSSAYALQELSSRSWQTRGYSRPASTRCEHLAAGLRVVGLSRGGVSAWIGALESISVRSRLTWKLARRSDPATERRQLRSSWPRTRRWERPSSRDITAMRKSRPGGSL